MEKVHAWRLRQCCPTPSWHRLCPVQALPRQRTLLSTTVHQEVRTLLCLSIVGLYMPAVSQKWGKRASKASTCVVADHVVGLGPRVARVRWVGLRYNKHVGLALR